MHVLLQIYIGNIYEIYCFTNRKFSDKNCVKTVLFFEFLKFFHVLCKYEKQTE